MGGSRVTGDFWPRTPSIPIFKNISADIIFKHQYYMVTIPLFSWGLFCKWISLQAAARACCCVHFIPFAVRSYVRPPQWPDPVKFSYSSTRTNFCWKYRHSAMHQEKRPRATPTAQSHSQFQILFQVLFRYLLFVYFCLQFYHYIIIHLNMNEINKFN